MFTSVRGQSTTNRRRNGGVGPELEIFSLNQINRRKWQDYILRTDGTNIPK
jgi:hypothetical protein